MANLPKNPKPKFETKKRTPMKRKIGFHESVIEAAINLIKENEKLLSTHTTHSFK
jgi:hypothetical protein